jgi:hypothetical protein
LEENQADKTFFIKAYFDDLEKKIGFLKELKEGSHKDEALMLCCCYIEALGSMQYHQSERKAKNYSMILRESAGNDIFGLVHPKQLKVVLTNQKRFKHNFSAIEPIIDGFANELVSQEIVTKKLSSIISTDQAEWLQNNIFKATIAAISYDVIRSELVHGISTANVTFSQTTFKGNPVPDLNFELLYSALWNIFGRIKKKSLETNKWYWEQ